MSSIHKLPGMTPCRASERERAWRSPLIAVQVVVRGRQCIVNTFVNGSPHDSVELDHPMTLGQALIWLGTNYQLQEE